MKKWTHNCGGGRAGFIPSGGNVTSAARVAGGDGGARTNASVTRPNTAAKPYKPDSINSKGKGNQNSKVASEVTRKQAFNQAKRDSGIPTSATPKKQGQVKDYKNPANDRRVYAYDVYRQNRYIIEHRNDPFGRGPHFHGAEQKYPGQDLFKADERYRGIQGTQGHYPEYFGGFRKNGR
ncbi:HNH/endonuclease VII fold putative polymorphic toxin [Paenibacillus assamensis]|uniref:HNH/endonuclease VII fold putative polymorphic toxin n=1 Tax=Paenibacillus assamensis TaxID=311244 RepID=UPI002480B135|nr:HNH/endonuclease VII fold putative polymorphic toxin [Paenibacillus assamensis]